MRNKTTRPKLTAEQRRRAEMLTAFASFAALLDYHRPLPGGYRGSLKPAAPALVSRWTDADRRAEVAERDLQLQLAMLADLAEAQPGRRVVVRPAARRAA